MNTLEINISYTRRFVGDATPIPSSSLAYPEFSYGITVFDDEEPIRNIAKSGLTYNGGFAMNLQVISGTLRDKKHEIKFANAIANTIIKVITKIANR